MAEMYDDLRGGDRVELEDVATGLFRDSLESAVEGAVAEVVESYSGDKIGKKVGAEIVSTVLGQIPRRLPASELIDELGRRGWELLPPAIVREVRRRLEVYETLHRTLAEKGVTRVKMQRKPRVKRLAEVQ